MAQAVLQPVRDDPRRRALRAAGARLPWLWIVVGAFAAVAVMRALQQPMPGYFPDETLYQHLARSLADGQGFTWRGDPVPLRAALYVYLITPAWIVASGVKAYDIAKVETALIGCLVAVPIWHLARGLLPRGLAVVAVALALSGSWSANPGGLMTESLALPLATATLAMTVQSLRRSSARLVWMAVLLAALTCWARMQLAVLVPVIFCALLLDVARSPGTRRARATLLRWPLIVLGGGLAVGTVAAYATPSTLLGGYLGVVDFDTVPLDVLSDSAQQLLQTALVCGILPLLLLGVLAVRPAAWRDAQVGPFLAVLVPAVLLLALQSGYFVAGYDVGWPIQRYVIYAAPALLLLCVVAAHRRALIGWPTWAAAGGLSLLLLLTPEVLDRAEERAAFATAARVQALVGDISTATAVTLVGAGLCAVAAGLAAVRGLRGRDGRAPAGAIGALLLLVLLAQSITAWRWEHESGLAVRPLLPDDAAWIDHHAEGPVAVLIATSNTVRLASVDFFNADITRVYAPSPLAGQDVQGAVCRWQIGRDGTLVFPAHCPPQTDRFWIDDPVVHLRFHDEASAVRDPRLGRLVTVRGAPRLESLVTMPCPNVGVRQEPVTGKVIPASTPLACDSQLSATLWLDRPATLVVTVRGAASAFSGVRVGGRAYQVPSGRLTTIRVRVGAGVRRRVFALDWARTSPIDPAIVDVALEQDGQRRSLL